MKILVICVFPPRAMAEADHAYHLCRHLADQGATVEVVTGSNSVILHHPHVVQHTVMQRWSWNEMPRLTRLIKRCSPEAILLYYIGSLYDHHPMITFAPTVARRILPKVPFVTMISNAVGSSPEDFGWPDRFLRRIASRLSGKDVDYNFGTLLRDSRGIIVMSQSHQRILEAKHNGISEKCALIPPPPLLTLSPETEEVRQSTRHRLRVGQEDFLLVYFGYLYYTKGIETLLKALSLVKQQKKNVRLALVGGTLQILNSRSYAEEMQGLAKELGLETIVTFTGGFSWDSAEASAYLRAADTCILPFNDGVSLNNSSFAAAVTHGLPVITTCHDNLEEAFLHQQNVYLCPPRDPEAMASAINTLIDNPALRQRLQRGALEFAEEWFSWEKGVKQIMRLLG